MWTKIKNAFSAISWARVGWVALAVTVTLGSYSAWVYNKGHAAASLACANSGLKAIDKSERDHAKVETQIHALPAGPLDDEWSRWLRR